MRLRNRSNARRASSLFFSALLLAVALPCHAQTPEALRPPRQIVLYVHGTMLYRAFVDPLVCMLQNALRAPVTTKVTDFPLDDSLKATPTQYDVERVLGAFYAHDAHKDSPGTFSFLLLSDDLKAEPFHYVFATGEGNASTSFHVYALSIARLDPGLFAHDEKDRERTTTLRAYKLIMKGVARLSGFGIEQGCILAFPRSLDELDAKSAEFCPADRAALVAAGLLRPNPGKGCNVIADDYLPPAFAGYSDE